MTSTVVHAVSAVSSNVMRIIFGGSSGGYYNAENKLLRDRDSASSTLNGPERLVSVRNRDDHHFLWNLPFDVTNLILGTISPSLAINNPDERHDNKTGSNNYHTASKRERHDDDTTNGINSTKSSQSIMMDLPFPF